MPKTNGKTSGNATTKEAPEQKKKPLWVFYKVTWNFLTSLCGQTPSDPDIVKKWLAARQPKVKPPGGKSMEEVQAEVFDTLLQGEEEQEISKLIFQRRDDVICMRASTIRSHLKDCARQVSQLYYGRVQGEKAFSTKVINGVYPDERMYWIPIMRQNGGGQITEADGERIVPIHATGPRGMPINAIKVFEYVNNAQMEFVLKVLGDSVRASELETLMMYAGTHGYAGERSVGEGKYTFEIEQIGQLFVDTPAKEQKRIMAAVGSIPAAKFNQRPLETTA